MENEIIKMLLDEIREEKVIRKRLVQKLESLNACSCCPFGFGARGRAVEEQRIVAVTEKPNSYVFGKAGNRFKIYFEKQEDAEKAIDACKRIEEYKDKKFKEEGGNEAK